MKSKNIKDLLQELEFFDGISEEKLEFLAGCGQNMHFSPNQYMGRENEIIQHLYVIKKGQVALEINHPIKGAMMMSTLGEGEIVGFNWIIPPYKYRANAKAMVETSVVALDAACVRRKCEEDHHLGYLLMKRSAAVANARLVETRMQMLDVYH